MVFNLQSKIINLKSQPVNHSDTRKRPISASALSEYAVKMPFHALLRRKTCIK